MGILILPFCLTLPLGSYSSLFPSAITDCVPRDDHFVGSRRTLFSELGWMSRSFSKLQLEEMSWGIKCGPHFLRLWSPCIKWKQNFSIAHCHLLSTCSCNITLNSWDPHEMVLPLLFLWKADWQRHRCDQQIKSAFNRNWFEFLRKEFYQLWRSLQTQK